MFVRSSGLLVNTFGLLAVSAERSIKHYADPADSHEQFHLRLQYVDGSVLLLPIQESEIPETLRKLEEAVNRLVEEATIGG